MCSRMAASFVLRHRCDGVEIPVAMQLIGEYACELPLTWDAAFLSDLSEAQVLRGVKLLCSRGLLDGWLWIFHSPWYSYRVTYMDVAAERGYLSVVRFLDEHGKRGFTARGVEWTAANGHYEVIKFLVARMDNRDGRAYTALRTAVENGHADIVQYLYELSLSTEPGRPSIPVESWFPSAAAKRGYLPVIEYLWAQDTARRSRRFEWSGYTIFTAMREGHAHVVKWFYEHTPLRCDIDSFPVAARHGDVELVQLLLDDHGTTIHSVLIQDMMNQAADGNHLELMRFLKTLGCNMMTKRAMDGAATHGKLAFVKYLQERSSAGCTTKAMDGAAENGHLDVLQFLHEHRKEGCTRVAIEKAAKHGHLDVVQFLHETMGQPLSDVTVEGALSCDDLAVIRYIHCRGGISPSDSYAKICIKNGHLEHLKYLWEHELTTLDVEDLELHSERNEDEIRAFVVEQVIKHTSRLGRKRTRWCNHKIRRALRSMAKFGKVKQIQFLDSKYDVRRIDCSEIIDAAAQDGRLDMLHYFHTRGYSGFSKHTMHHALDERDLATLKFLNEVCRLRCPPKAIDAAVEYGGVELVQYLHEHCGATATTNAMDTAAARGKLDIVQFLHKHRSEGCTADALLKASQHGHLLVVQYLCSHRREGSTVDAMKRATANGHTDIVEYLRESARGRTAL